MRAISYVVGGFLNSLAARRRREANVFAPYFIYCFYLFVGWFIHRSDAMVCGRWRKMIRMVDEQEGCEWMDVSSGTGSSG